MKLKAFSLVELLVVIAIIALLVGILLPVLAKARNAGRLSASMSNVRQLGVGYTSYRLENKDLVPLAVSGDEGGTTQIAPWTFGGKFCNPRWIQRPTDVHPLDRPLNSYVYPGFTCERFISAELRRGLELPIFKSPGDRSTSAVDQIMGTEPIPEPDFSRSTYDDVGTSYQANVKWWKEVEDSLTINAATARRPGESDFSWMKRVLKDGSWRINRAAETMAAKFVWVFDQTGQNVSADNQARNWKGEFGDINKAVAGFLDGHVDYITMVPAQYRGPGYTLLYSKPTDRHPGAGG